MMLVLKRNLIQRITFVMVDAAGGEVEALGTSFSVEVSKNGGAFTGGTGTKGEIGSGWYIYELTAAETDTPGPLSVRVNGAGCQQQNLWYAVQSLILNGIEFTYTITDTSTSSPISGVQVWITTDVGGTVVVWQGETNAFGIAVDEAGALPYLSAGTFYFWRNKIGYEFTDPDIEVVS